ncbi:MAG: toast rack family protein [Candidatus Zixiibacteriota bacterium]
MWRAILSLFVGATLASGAVGGALEHKTETVVIHGADRLSMNCSFGAGELIINPGDIPDAARLNVAYDPRRVDYDVEYEVKGSTGYLRLDSEWKRHRNVNTNDNRWDLVLPRKYPLDAKFEIGACDAEIDLGGLSLTELKLEVGAASGTIDFSRPNPERLREMRIEAGASSLKLINLGNANFEYLKFSGGAGSFDMDFRGEYHGESEAKIEIGLGSADIILPRGLAVRVETEDDNWFSSVDIDGGDLDKVSDDVWETPDFENAKDRLVMRLDVGMGSVDFRWKK